MPSSEISEMLFELCVVVFFLHTVAGVVIVSLFEAAINGAVAKIRGEARKDQEAHEKWLFNQLYSMAPGKVLEPEAREEVVEERPATVYSPDADPMSEFTGIRDDWHGKS